MRVAGTDAICTAVQICSSLVRRKSPGMPGSTSRNSSPAAADEQVRLPDAGLNGVCRRFQRHISGMMPIGIVADLEIIHIQQCDPRRADDLADDLFVIAAVVCSLSAGPDKALP